MLDGGTGSDTASWYDERSRGDGQPRSRHRLRRRRPGRRPGSDRGPHRQPRAVTASAAMPAPIPCPAGVAMMCSVAGPGPTNSTAAPAAIPPATTPARTAVTVNLAAGPRRRRRRPGRRAGVGWRTSPARPALTRSPAAPPANVLNGWAGQDVPRGGGGADRFVFSAASPTARSGRPTASPISATPRATGSTCRRSTPTPPRRQPSNT